MLRSEILEYTIQPTTQPQIHKPLKSSCFSNDLIMMIKAESIVEAVNIANVELNKMTAWAIDNKIRFNEKKIKGNANDKKETKRTKRSRYILEQ